MRFVKRDKKPEASKKDLQFCISRIKSAQFFIRAATLAAF
jgi:hypothetical protein